MRAIRLLRTSALAMVGILLLTGLLVASQATDEQTREEEFIVPMVREGDHAGYISQGTGFEQDGGVLDRSSHQKYVDLTVLDSEAHADATGRWRDAVPIREHAVGS